MVPATMRGGTRTPSFAIVEMRDASWTAETPTSWPMEIEANEILDHRSTVFDMPRVSPGSSMPEAEGANVFVEAIITETHCDLDGANVARFGNDVGNGEQSMRLAVVDPRAVNDDRTHLTIEYFVRACDFLFEACGDRDDLEG